MPKLRRGITRIKGRSSYYTRIRKNGHDKWRSLGPDYGEACLKLDRIRGSELPVGSFGVAQIAARWLASYVPVRRTSRYAADTASRVERFLKPFFGGKPFGRLTGDDFRQYRICLEGHVLKPETVRHVLADARCMCRWSYGEGLVSRSPFPQGIMPKIPERPPDRLTDAEVDSVLTVGEPHAFVLRLGLGTGLRWSELCAAQAAHLESDALVVASGKTGRVRRVPIISRALLAEIKGRVGRLVPFADTSHGSFARVVQNQSGVTRFHPHQLRHTYGCRFIEDDGKLIVLQKILGHASITTTMKYAQASDEFVRAEAQRLAK